MFILIEYSDNHSKTSGIFWQCCKDEPALNNTGAVFDFTVANSITDLLKIKENITGQTKANDTKDAAIMVPLKYVSNFWRTLEIPLIDCKINLDLLFYWSWSIGLKIAL